MGAALVLVVEKRGCNLPEFTRPGSWTMKIGCVALQAVPSPALSFSLHATLLSPHWPSVLISAGRAALAYQRANPTQTPRAGPRVVRRFPPGRRVNFLAMVPPITTGSPSCFPVSALSFPISNHGLSFLSLSTKSPTQVFSFHSLS